MANSNIHYVRGIAHWAKVIGEPRKNNFDDYREWTVDVSLDEDGIQKFKTLGVGDRLREPKSGEDRGPFYTFKQKEFRADGETKNDPIKIVDKNNKPWNGALIGNGSVVDVKFAFQPAAGKKKAGVYVRAIRVLEHVPFESQEFAPLDEDDEYFASEDEGAPFDTEDFDSTDDDDLNDDIPE